MKKKFQKCHLNFLKLPKNMQEISAHSVGGISYELRGVYWEREKKVKTILCNKTNKQCKNFDFSKNKIPCITFFKDLLYKVLYMFYENYFFFNFSHSSTNTYMQKLPKILPHIDIITETSKKTELYSLKLTCLIFGSVTRSPFLVDIVKISAPRCISFACSLRRCIWMYFI